jgi:hypothetical protein
LRGRSARQLRQGWSASQPPNPVRSASRRSCCVTVGRLASISRQMTAAYSVGRCRYEACSVSM